MREALQSFQQAEHGAHLARRTARDVNERQQFRRGAALEWRGNEFRQKVPS
jgi:hypothetical protein